jgi:hypothetical protein
MLDWLAHSLDTFIRVVHQNSDRLSVNKRKSHFEWMSEEEVRRAEEVVAESFRQAARIGEGHGELSPIGDLNAAEEVQVLRDSRSVGCANSDHCRITTLSLACLERLGV